MQHAALLWMCACSSEVLPACCAATHALQCTLCPVGTYQPLPGQQLCILCSGSTYTTAAGATSASACSLQSTPVDYDAVAAQLAANLTQSSNNTLVGRHLLQSANGTGTVSRCAGRCCRCTMRLRTTLATACATTAPITQQHATTMGVTACENTCTQVEVRAGHAMALRGPAS